MGCTGLCCCAPCNYQMIDVSSELQERRIYQERLLNKWEELGGRIRENIEDLEIGDLNQIANQLNEINRRLLERKKNIQKTFRCTKFAYSSSTIGIIVTSVITGALLSVSALTSCAEQGTTLQYICISAAALGFVVPLVTLVFQKCHDKIKEEKIYLESFSEQEARDDKLAGQIVSSIHDFQILHASELNHKMDLILKRLSEHGQELLQDEHTVQGAKLLIEDDFKRNVELLPSKYKYRNRWKQAITAIKAANRVSQKRSRNLDFSNELSDFSANHPDLRNELLKSHSHRDQTEGNFIEIDMTKLKHSSSNEDYEQNI